MLPNITKHKNNKEPPPDGCITAALAPPPSERRPHSQPRRGHCLSFLNHWRGVIACIQNQVILSISTDIGESSCSKILWFELEHDIEIFFFTLVSNFAIQFGFLLDWLLSTRSFLTRAKTDTKETSDCFLCPKSVSCKLLLFTVKNYSSGCTFCILSSIKAKNIVSLGLLCLYTGIWKINVKFNQMLQPYWFLLHLIFVAKTRTQTRDPGLWYHVKLHALANATKSPNWWKGLVQFIYTLQQYTHDWLLFTSSKSLHF
jgi:hypothetical protein